MILNECIGKLTKSGKTFTVEEHCLLVAKLGQIISKFLKLELTDEALLIFSLHDIGKIYPTFQQKIYAELGIDKGFFKSKDELKLIDKNTGYHSSISANYKKQKAFQNIVGRHHGFSNETINNWKISKYALEFKELQDEFYFKMKQYFNIDEQQFNLYLNNLTSIQIDLLSGILCISDWLASGILLEYSNKFKNFNDSLLTEQLTSILQKFGFFDSLDIIKNLSFNDIFGFNSYRSQNEVINNINDYGFYLYEDEPGRGKTETALYSAYKMNIKNDMRGITFLLPTKLTSNKIYERFNIFLENITNNKEIKSNLLYGDSYIYLTAMEQLSKSVENNAEIETDENQLNFFENKYLKFQYAYNTGTIDQALLSVLNTKFNFVKLISLYNKVIIIDEIHSYDIYTANLIKYLIKYAKELKCVIIALSATTSNKTKNIFFDHINFNNNYPLLSYSTDSIKFNECTIYSNFKSKNIIFNIQHLEDKVIDKIILLAELGAQIGWIENTKRKAQDIYYKLKQRCKDKNIELGLIHSKFLQADRLINEDYWTKQLGKFGKSNRNECGRILIGTQILEQSIDIDFDKLVTRIAPIEMIVQRCGRLHRHNNSRIKECELNECIILSPRLNEIDNMKKATEIFIDSDNDEFSGIIYPKHILYATLKYLTDYQTLNIPGDIRNAINFVYDYSNNSNKIFNELKLSFENNYAKKLDFSNNNVYKDNLTKCGNNVSCETRLINENMIKIYIIKNNENNKILFLSGEILDLESNEKSTNYMKYILNLNSVEENIHKVKEYLKYQTNISKNFKKYFEENSLIVKLIGNELELLNGIKLKNIFYDKQIGLYFSKI